MEQFEEILKSALISLGFRRAHKYRKAWVKQVQDINNYWDHLIGDVKLNELMADFEYKCKRYDIECNPWDIVAHLRKAQTDWKIELMTEVANRIAQFWCDETEGEFVQWTGDDMMLLIDVT